MSNFKESLIQLADKANELSPKDILPVLLKNNSNNVVSNLAIIIAEMLIPGSQKLPPTFFHGGNSLPESTAKGYQLRVVLESIDKKFNISWYIVFTKVQEEYLFESSQRNIVPDMLNINQFLSAIDFKNGLLDIFLNYDWYFSKKLVLDFHKLEPKDGAYDLNSSNNLTRCFDEVETTIETQLGKRNIISFINIGKLELHVMNHVMAHNSRDQLSSELSKIFDHHCHTFPEYLLSACLATADKNPFILNIIDSLFSLLIDHNSKFLNQVMMKFKELDNQLALEKLVDYYIVRNSTESLLKVFNIAMELNFIPELVNKAWDKNFKLGLMFTINSSCFGYDIKGQIDTMFNDPNQKPMLLQSVVEILELRCNEDQQQTSNPSIDNYKSLPLPTVYYLLSILGKNNGIIDNEKFKNLQLQLLTCYPRLINFGTGHDEAILENAKNHSGFPEDIELEMKEYYSQLYNKKLDSNTIVDMLVRLKGSDVPRDQDVLACMIHSLLDEYRFFSEYPIDALASTSLLFGALLQKDIIQGTTLTVALNFIWESCNSPPDSHLFKFAAQALYNFKSRLHEYPNYCKRLLDCKSLSTHPLMYKIVQDASNGIPCVDSKKDTSSGEKMNRRIEDSGLKYQSLFPTNQTIGLITQEKPNESVSDKLLFFVNNLTEDNLNGKLGEIKDLLSENFFLWFADYLVGDRAKIEPNYHKLYCDLVNKLDNAILHEYILNVSLSEVSNLIRNFKDTFNERNHLKNLGSWLGQITLASDRPLKRNQIGLKFLLVESFDFKTLNIIIPFVCKILDQAQYSKIFRPPNPWVMGVFKVLVELYECGDLKLNSKFEIEVLLNSFNMKVSEITPSSLIRSHNPNPQALAALFGIQPNGNNLTSEFSKMTDNFVPQFQSHPPIPQMVQNGNRLPEELANQGLNHQAIGQGLGQAQGQAIGHQPIGQGQGVGPNQTPNQGPPQLDTSFSTLIGNTIFTQNPNLRRAFQASLSRAVRECAIPILNRTTESVLTTTEALIKKDFAREGDINKFRKSYQTLALKLSQSMIACNGRKILSETVENTMLQLLSHQINLNDLPLGELNSAIQSNVDLCVDIVNRLAAGHIIESVDDRMRSGIIAREQSHQKGEQFVDNTAGLVNLPLPLGIKAEGLAANQLSIYENFGVNIIRESVPLQSQPPQPQPPQPQPPQPQPPQQQQQQPPMGMVQSIPPNLPHGPMIQEEIMPAEQLFMVISQHCDRLVASSLEVKQSSLSELTPDHPLMQSIGTILSLAQSNALKFPELLLKVAQYAVNCLFTQNNDKKICTEIFVFLLDKLCELSPSTAKDVIWWLVHSTDQRKFNVPVMYSLLKVQLIQPIKLDISLSKFIRETSNPLLVKFAGSLLIKIFKSDASEPEAVATRSEFAMTLDCLARYDGEDGPEVKQAKETRDQLFEMLKLEEDGQFDDMFSQLGYIFTEWVKLISHGGDIEHLKRDFILNLQTNGILTDPELFGLFFKAAIEISIASYPTEQEIKARTLHETTLTVDALGLLIVKILVMFEDDEVVDTIKYLKNIMGVILVALTNDHESPANWNERAYFRFFSSLLSYWNDESILVNDATKHLDGEFFNFIGDVFNSLQPIILPGFTFAWISLISHRMFLPKVLASNNHNTVIKLLSALLRFQAVYSKDEETNDDLINAFFKAIYRIFVGIYHDYPEFLAENYIQLLAIIPMNYLQLRNIVLSATPKDIILESPFTPGLKVERIESIKSLPTVNYPANEELSTKGLKKPIDNYLRIPASGLIKTIYNGLKIPAKSVDFFGFDTINYNLELINGLVLYVTNSKITEMNGNYSFNAKDSHVSIFYDLLNFGSTEFKYHLISSLANQLRYPNVHTHWTLGIFLQFINLKTSWSNNETKSTIQEIIARTLIERHIVQRPHQWGLTILFTELIKNANYNFFSLPFVKNAPPEVKLLLDSLSTSS
ncbi:general negative regulator of transcription subunit 1 [[Candida] jaroonii]|uniref:General negative regulator of transcription subunit 1 n=1 Tax=[Candida] jaroonii TaxID=467808 RepID=A0ACA9YF74_9ASCO|nr:general negative regulator of transcription subunit 1 [[Candida] jaroonii]